MVLDWLLSEALPPPGMSRQQALYRSLRDAILTRRLAAGTRLPSTRQLAASLGIARNTVLFAYEQLVAEGCLLAGRHGTRVADLPVSAMPVRPAAPPDGPGLSARAAFALERETTGELSNLPFCPGLPDLGAFPFRAWRACLERAWREAGWRQLAYARDGGEPLLREALAEHLASVRGFAVTPQQVIITAGMQSGLELCARLLADPAQIAWVENPGYPAARTALGLAGLNLHDVGVDDEGLAPSAEDWACHPPRLIMVTPSHQYPTGRVMSLARRLALLQHARGAGAWIIEDDYDSEFRRDGAALPALYGLQFDAPVVYAGTFSKTMYPGLRIAYLVVPMAIAETFVRAAGQATRPGQGIEQMALADFIRRGHYTRHLRQMRTHYARRQAALRTALARHPGPELRITGGAAGLHLVLWLPPALPDQEVVRRALALGLGPRPLSDYARSPSSCNGLVLGYGTLAEDRADGAVRRLRAVMQ